MTPFEIFATNGHLRGPVATDRPAAASHAGVDDLVSRQAFTSVSTVERWVRRVLHG